MAQGLFSTAEIIVDVCQSNSSFLGSDILVANGEEIPVSALNSTIPIPGSAAVEHEFEWTIIAQITGTNPEVLIGQNVFIVGSEFGFALIPNTGGFSLRVSDPRPRFLAPSRWGLLVKFPVVICLCFPACLQLEFTYFFGLTVPLNLIFQGFSYPSEFYFALAQTAAGSVPELILYLLNVDGSEFFTADVGSFSAFPLKPSSADGFFIGYVA